VLLTVEGRFVVGSDSQAALTVKPLNTVALVGDRVVLRCSTNSSGGDGSLIEWTFGTERPNCVHTRDQCNLIIASVQVTDAGAYDCSDGTRGSDLFSVLSAQASLIVIGN